MFRVGKMHCDKKVWTPMEGASAIDICQQGSHDTSLEVQDYESLEEPPSGKPIPSWVTTMVNDACWLLYWLLATGCQQAAGC